MRKTIVEKVADKCVELNGMLQKNLEGRIVCGAVHGNTNTPNFCKYAIDFAILNGRAYISCSYQKKPRKNLARIPSIAY